jgi:hypothetical protein
MNTLPGYLYIILINYLHLFFYQAYLLLNINVMEKIGKTHPIHLFKEVVMVKLFGLMVAGALAIGAYAQSGTCDGTKDQLKQCISEVCKANCDAMKICEQKMECTREQSQERCDKAASNLGEEGDGIRDCLRNCVQTRERKREQARECTREVKAQ